ALLDGHAQVYDPHGDSSPGGTGQCLTAFYARRWRFCLLQAGGGCRLSPGRTPGILAPASEPDPREDAMDGGPQMIFASYGWSGVSDEQVWDEELRLARLAADHGFDVLWSVEHHGNDYSFCPDNLQLMSYLAAVCPDIGLGTAAVILPWHDPLRVAEQVSILDHLSRGRLRLGIGR